MSLTDEQIKKEWSRICSFAAAGVDKQISFARAIESEATAPPLERIAEMEEMNAQLREQNTAVDKACADLEAHIEQLERELEALRKDAERYRFIRDANRSSCIDSEIATYAMESLDEYVDAAMEDEQRINAAKEKP
jgi:predicted RNase H-like nuclease (RuvC/YqgF family)